MQGFKHLFTRSNSLKIFALKNSRFNKRFNYYDILVFIEKPVRGKSIFSFTVR